MSVYYVYMNNCTCANSFEEKVVRPKADLLDHLLHMALCITVHLVYATHILQVVQYIWSS